MTNMEDAFIGTAACNVGCELARARRDDKARPRLERALENFLRHRDELEVTRSSVIPRERRMYVSHWGAEHTARYDFSTGHWRIPEKDGSFRDSRQYGYVYSTAMALMMLSDRRWLGGNTK